MMFIQAYSRRLFKLKCNIFKRIIESKKSNSEDLKNENHKMDQYRYAIEFINEIINKENNNEDKVIILDFISNLIKKDMQYSILTTILYNKEHSILSIEIPIPLYYVDEHYNQCSIINEKKIYKDVDLSKDTVLVLPWNRNRLRDNIKNIRDVEFKYQYNNHYAYYFTDIDLCCVYNGIHSTTAGIGYSKGSIEAEIANTSKLYNHVSTNGISWINVHTDKELCEVSDFRTAILFQIAKEKVNLK